MEPNIYIGIFFKPKSGGVVCIYTPDPETSPKFWYFNSGDSIGFISDNITKLIHDKHQPIIVHINKVNIKESRQLATYNQFIGMIAGMSSSRTVTTKIVTQDKVQSRIMQLLSIAKKRDFKSKLLSKKMHNNKYNIVYDITCLKSRQSINNHMWAYLLAYYGYLKYKIHGYNKQEHKHGKEDNTKEGDQD
jgi:hypothetical protein